MYLPPLYENSNVCGVTKITPFLNFEAVTSADEMWADLGPDLVDEGRNLKKKRKKRQAETPTQLMFSLNNQKESKFQVYDYHTVI